MTDTVQKHTQPITDTYNTKTNISTISKAQTNHDFQGYCLDTGATR